MKETNKARTVRFPGSFHKAFKQLQISGRRPGFWPPVCKAPSGPPRYVAGLGRPVVVCAKPAVGMIANRGSGANRMTVLAEEYSELLMHISENGKIWSN